jgi:hypothetical protein
MLHRISLETHTVTTVHEEPRKSALPCHWHNKCCKLFMKAYFSGRHLKSVINYILNGPANPGPGASNTPFWTVLPAQFIKKAQV